MDPRTELDIATAPRKNSKRWKLGKITWGEILLWAKEPADHKECGNYLLGRLAGERRTKNTILGRGAITLDVDYADKGFLNRVVMEFPWAYMLHTTFNSSPDDQRFRLIAPTDREMTPEEYEAVCSVVMDTLGRSCFDQSTAEPSRYMFKPSAQEPGWYRSWVEDGDAIPVDEAMKDFDPDLSKLPTPKIHPNKRDPFAIEGVVGAFNRAYSFEELIEDFDLPYEPAGELRWHLVGAVSEAGMGVVSEGLVFSHHTTDPAWGQTCSAFDLVRLHRFGDLDDATPETTPVNRRPSNQEMLKFAASDSRVVRDLVGGDFDDDSDDGSHDWRLKIRISPRTGKFLDEIENWDLVTKNDPAFQGLYFNEMTLTVETERELPWRDLDPGREVFTGTDRAALCHYLEREYKIRAARTFVDELVNVRAYSNPIHPVQVYLKGLVWDKKPRIETCLPGVIPTKYTRMVARKCMTAAAARIMDPGCKWDHTLVLYGAEGLGKSWWIEKVSRGYSASLGKIGDKDTLLTMQRSWIMVADEGYSLRKSDADQQKEFLTRTEDVFRMPYDREALVHKRHSVIWGTTNDEVFLRRQEGNRRFLIVRCDRKVNFGHITDEYIDQLWAEAMFRYRAGERLFLEEDEGLLAASEREKFTEEDALAGVIEDYLEMMVPDGWDDMSPEARIQWRNDRADKLVPKGTNRLTEMCSAQVWVEALGRRFGDHRRSDLLEITDALKRIPGWKLTGKRRRIANYGPQLLFERENLI